MTHQVLPAAIVACFFVLSGCGGGSAAVDPSPSNASATNAGGSAGTEAAGASGLHGDPAEDDPLPNAMPVVVDGGPGLFWFTGRKVINTLFANVTVCTPGSTTECQTIDHVAVDTGSVGLRLLDDALPGTAHLRPVVDAAGSALRECVQFADGYTWGSVVSADVEIGGRKLGSLPVNVIGDAAAGSAPKSCVSGAPKNSVTAFGANGVLGIGGFLRDCGPGCASNATPGWYYVCPGNTCRPASVPLEQQVPNPVARLGRDNNGVTLQLPPVGAAGAPVARGTLYFGVDTQANNALGAARLFTLDSVGTLLTSHAGGSQRAIVDSGANGYFFTSDIATCARNKAFYCPAPGGVPGSVQQTAAILGRNGATQTVNFSVDNVDQIYNGQTALPGLGAPLANMVGGASTVFTWGLPFFYGRTVHVLFEGRTAAATTGPAVGF